jgi:hypothetical protein
MDQQLKIFDPKMISFSGNQLLQPSTNHKTDHFLGFCQSSLWFLHDKLIKCDRCVIAFP